MNSVSAIQPLPDSEERTADAHTADPGEPDRPGEHQLLSWARSLSTPVLRHWVGQLPSPLRDMAGYHFGWQDECGKPSGTHGGKTVRAALALASAQASGGRAERALPAAVAVELVHNFSLVHDDILDGDALRRHRAAVWSVFGRDDAMLLGDALFALAYRVLAGTPAPRVGPTLYRLAEGVHEMATGQVHEAVFQHSASRGVERCMEVALGKTGALMGAACAMGAVAAGADEARTARFRDFGRQLGLAFQITDDTLGIWGDPARTGKPAGSDLAARKKTLPVTAALASRSEPGRELGAMYAASDDPGPADVARMKELVERAGGRAWAAAMAEDCLREAAACLERAHPVPEAAEGLMSLAAALCRRDA